MGVVAVVAMALAAWCACALLVGVLIGRAIAMPGRKEPGREEPAVPRRPRSSRPVQPTSTSR